MLNYILNLNCLIFIVYGFLFFLLFMLLFFIVNYEILLKIFIVPFIAYIAGLIFLLILSIFEMDTLNKSLFLKSPYYDEVIVELKNNLVKSLENNNINKEIIDKKFNSYIKSHSLGFFICNYSHFESNACLSYLKYSLNNTKEEIIKEQEVKMQRKLNMRT